MTIFPRKTAAIALSAAVLAASAGLASASTFDGATIQATTDYPTLGSGFSVPPINAVVGAGVEFSDGDFGAFFGPTFDFSGDTITITHDDTSHSAGDFNGYVFHDVFDTLANFTGLSVLSDTTGFFSGDLSRVFFDDDNLYVNFESLSFGSEDEVIVLQAIFADVAAVPLPGSLPLLGFGALALGFMRRKNASA